MATTIGSLDLNAFSDLYSDSTQYFWFESNASATYGAGVHITLLPDTSFIANPTGQNILMNTDGISIRNGLLPMMVLDNNSLNFNIVDTTNQNYTNVASFGTNGIFLGEDGNMKMFIGNTSIFGQNSREFSVFEINSLPSGTYNNKNAWFEYNNESPFECVFRWNCTSINNNVQCYDSSFNRVVGLNPQPTLSNNTAIFDDTQCTQLQNNSVKYILMGYTAVGAFPYFTFGERGAGTIGRYSTCIGEACVASNDDSYAEGLETKASGEGAHAEGNGTNASGGYSHAEGYDTNASGVQAHSEGHSSIASGSIAHAEGFETTASGYASHAEGAYTIASGDSSHAQNEYTVATEDFQTVIGKYNAATVTGSGTDADPYVYSDVGDYAFIIGNGTGNTTNARSNAFTVDWNGQIGSPTTAVASTTITTFTSGWAAYNDEMTPTLRRYGRIVSLTGALKNTASKTLNTTDTKIFSLPTTDGWTEYLPKQLISCISHGSGANHFLFRVFPANDSEHPAEVTFARYTSGTSYSSIASGAWFPFHVTWIA